MTYLKNSFNSIISSITNKPDYFHIPHYITKDLNIMYPLDYYIDLRPKIVYQGKFDEKSVILIYLDKKVGWIYYPITIFNYGLAAFQNYSSNKDKIFMEKMLSQIEWACTNQIKEGKYQGAWKFNFDNPTFNLKSGWISAMAQGLGISLLLRAWLITKNQDYADVAEQALIPYTKAVNDGGLIAQFQSKYFFLEEYPSSPPSFVLNGYVSAILGLRDLAIFTGSDQAEKMWNECIITLKEILTFYDTGYWSRYDLREGSINIASMFYHKYHITLLLLLYELTNDEVFKFFALKFKNYEKNVFCKSRAFVHKVFWRFNKLI